MFYGEVNLINENRMPYKLLMGHKPVAFNFSPNELIQYAKQHEQSIK